MSTYGDRQDEPMSELEVEEQRAGVEPDHDPERDRIGSPIWLAGLEPTSGQTVRSSSNDRSDARRGFGSRLRSMVRRHHK
jgi:hypothetical protein